MNWQVELHNFCNFTCGYCPNKDMKRKREFMRDEVWQTILLKYILPFKDVNSHCSPTFIGHKDSEPLIDRNFMRRLQFLSDVIPDIQIDIYSNGVLLPVLAKQGRDLFEFLAKIPNKIRYLMSYHPFNHDNSINDYEATIKYLANVLTHKPPSNVEFITVSHKSKWVTEEMQEDWKNTWKGLPIAVHCNCSLNPWTGLIQEEGTIKFNRCPYQDFDHWFFGVTGNIIPCCLDLEEEIVLGNVMTNEPYEMFEKTKEFYHKQREALKLGLKPEHPLCYNCFGYDRDEPQSQLVQLGVPAA